MRGGEKGLRLGADGFCDYGREGIDRRAPLRRIREPFCLRVFLVSCNLKVESSAHEHLAAPADFRSRVRPSALFPAA
jgi:hypothetical protein